MVHIHITPNNLLSHPKILSDVQNWPPTVTITTFLIIKKKKKRLKNDLGLKYLKLSKRNFPAAQACIEKQHVKYNGCIRRKFECHVYGNNRYHC